MLTAREPALGNARTATTPCNAGRRSQRKRPAGRSTRTALPGLLLLAFASVLVQGYHFGTDDAEIYLPAIKQVVDPHLYPYGSDFFLAHAHMSHLATIVGHTALLFHVHADTAIFLWHLVGVALLVYAGWRLATNLFARSRAIWSATAVLALTASVPVAGTALFIADPYFTARSLSTPLTLLAVASFLEGRRAATCLWLILAALVHPQMVVYTVGLIGFLLLEDFLAARRRLPSGHASGIVSKALATPLLSTFSFHASSGAYRQALYMRTFFFVNRWPWWEWVGVFIPLAIIWEFSRRAVRGTASQVQGLCRALVWFAGFSTAVALVIASSPRFDTLTRLQPMRSFHVLYVFMFLLLGGVLGEYVLQGKPLRCAAFFVPLSAGMCGLNLAHYSHSEHIELPGHAPKNQWVQGFVWVRNNTPKTAIFAIDPSYLELDGVDEHGFRAVAERSVLSDYYKDSGAVTMFPQLLQEWQVEQAAQAGWDHFTPEDFKRLKAQFGVTWVVLHRSVAGMDCPYHNAAVLVCRV